jgi:transcriptional regulator with XRE-family HTH domain
MSNPIGETTLQTKEEPLSVSADSAEVPSTPPGGWLRAVRKARGVSQQQLAEKLGFKRQAWAQLEASEAREAISLYSLRRAADALGYELEYSLVPRERSPDEAAGEGAQRSGDGAVTPTHPPRLELAARWSTPDLPTELR